MCGGKIVNVVLNSNNALSGSTNNNATYSIDFGAILKPNKPYKLHWTYVGQANTITVASKIAQIMLSFNMEQYSAGSIYGAPTTMIIGCLRTFYVNGTINYLFADDNNNPPIYLQNRPAPGRFNVQVLTNDTTPTGWLDNAGTPVVNGNYVMTLSFQEMDSPDGI